MRIFVKKTVKNKSEDEEKKMVTMKEIKFIIPIMLLSVLPCSLLMAEETKQANALSLDECVAVAMHNNVDVLTAQNNIVVAKSKLASAKSEYLPTLTLQNNAFVVGGKDVLSQSTTGTAFTVSQDIFDGGVREASVQSSRFGVKQNVAGMNRTQQTVVYNVSKAYYEALRARHLAEVAQANVDYNKGLYDQVQARAEAGTAAKIDVYPIEAQLASAKVSLLSAQNTVKTTLIDLQNIMGLSTKPNFDVKEVSAQPDMKLDSLDSYNQAAVKVRPDILQYQAAINSARASTRSARIELYPRPVISANYQRQVYGGYTSSGSQIVGGISFDIFNGGANRAAYNQAKANQANAVLQEQQAARDVGAQVEEAYLNLTSAKERVDASAVSLESSDKNYTSQKERYAQGLGTTLDLLNAEVQLVTAQSDDVQARYDYFIAIAQMKYAVGK